MGEFPTLDDLQKARERIAPHVTRTPVLTSRTMNARAQAELFFKCENFQRVGAFKFRGACNAVMAMDDPVAVATHSSGNHAQAVALAAQIRGIEAHVVMPIDAPRAKRAAVEGYGARVIECAPTLEARERTLEKVLLETNATAIHPYNDPFVIAGQASATLELLEEVPGLDVILIPVGGGGLMSGCALACHYTSPNTKVIACEPAMADDARQGFLSGERIAPRPPRTVADGLRTALGPLTFAIMQAHVTDVRTVTESAIVDTTRLMFERMKLVVEPSAAVPVAVALEGKLSTKRIGVVISGGNLDLDRLPWQEN